MFITFIKQYTMPNIIREMRLYFKQENLHNFIKLG